MIIPCSRGGFPGGTKIVSDSLCYSGAFARWASPVEPMNAFLATCKAGVTKIRPVHVHPVIDSTSVIDVFAP